MPHHVYIQCESRDWGPSQNASWPPLLVHFSAVATPTYTIKYWKVGFSGRCEAHPFILRGLAEIELLYVRARLAQLIGSKRAVPHFEKLFQGCAKILGKAENDYEPALHPEIWDRKASNSHKGTKN